MSNQKMETLDDILRKPAFSPRTGITRLSVLEGLEAAGAHSLNEPMVQDVLRMAMRHFKHPEDRREAFAVAQGAALLMVIKRGEGEAARKFFESRESPIEQQMVLGQFDRMARSARDLTPQQSEALMRFRLDNTPAEAWRRGFAEKRDTLSPALISDARQKGYAAAAEKLETLLKPPTATLVAKPVTPSTIPKPVARPAPAPVVPAEKMDYTEFYVGVSREQMIAGLSPAAIEALRREGKVLAVRGSPKALEALGRAKASTNREERDAMMRRIADGEFEISFYRGRALVKPMEWDLERYAQLIFDPTTQGRIITKK